MANFKFWRQRVYKAAKDAKRGISNARYSTSDVAQESILQLLRGYSENDDSEKYSGAYLEKVGQGNASQMLRANMAQKRAMNMEQPPTAQDFLSDEKSPLELLEDSENIVRLIDAISRLSTNQQKIVYRRNFDQKTWQQIADEVGQTVNVVRRHHDQAFVQLRVLLTNPVAGDE